MDNIKWLSSAAGRYKGYIAALVAVQAVSGFGGVLYALLFRNIVDYATAKETALFRQNVLLLALLVIAQMLLSAILRRLSEASRADMENTLKLRLFDTILHRRYSDVSSVHTAEWLNRLTNDTVVIARGYTEILPGLVGTVVRLVSAVIMIILLDSWFAWLIIPGGIVLIGISYAFRKILKKLHKNIQESDGRLRIFLQERIESLMVIKSFTAEDSSLDGAKEHTANHRAARMKRNAFGTICGTGFSAAMHGMYLAGMVYCAHGILTGGVTYGTLTAVIQLIGQIESPFASISGYLPRWYAMTASIERLREAEKWDSDPAPLDAETVTGEYISGGIRFDNVSFSYKEGETVIDGLDLEIHSGDIIAFTGRSGCGKSTVLSLLMAMYPPDSGEILINGKPLTSAHRRLFAYVPQGNALLSGSIRNIVSLSEPQYSTDDARIRRALDTACADFAEDIDAVLGERGTGLSEGQMQRIAVARALFSDAPILLLDESTSALDEATERRLLSNISKTGKTVIIVTHRRAALEICTRTVDFDHSDEPTP